MAPAVAVLLGLSHVLRLLVGVESVAAAQIKIQLVQFLHGKSSKPVSYQMFTYKWESFAHSNLSSTRQFGGNHVEFGQRFPHTKNGWVKINVSTQDN